MKNPEPGKSYYFVDESGDPTFIGRRGKILLGTEGCSPILVLGFVECEDPHTIRNTLAELRTSIVNDSYFAGVPSLDKTKMMFHAKDDLPEIRMLVFKALSDMDFKAQAVVGRKILQMFTKKFAQSTNAFYEDLVQKLFENVLHRRDENLVYFSARSSKKRQEPFLRAVRAAVTRFEQKWNTTVTSSTSVGVCTPWEEPCLQVIDYALWAIHRAYTKGEMRFFETIREKFSLIADPYDRENYPNVYYDRRRNPFNVKKVSPLQLGPPRTRGM
ncbi:MAG: DUF3800 domain-containing protein [Phycisphaerae bacterium]